jgi:hypothetical protein
MGLICLFGGVGLGAAVGAPAAGLLGFVPCLVFLFFAALAMADGKTARDIEDVAAVAGAAYVGYRAVRHCTSHHDGAGNPTPLWGSEYARPDWELDD